MAPPRVSTFSVSWSGAGSRPAPSTGSGSTNSTRSGGGGTGPPTAAARPSAAGSAVRAGGRALRNIDQFISHAVMAADTPTSSAAMNPTCQADGPIVASRSPPSGPPASAARPAATHPVSAPVTNPHSGAASYTALGRTRTVSVPPTMPARNGAASASRDSAGAGPASGNAASSGNVGTASRKTPVGETLVPVPMEKPGPIAYAMPHITALGKNTNSTRNSSSPPTRPGASTSYSSLAWLTCIASDTATSSAPDASSVAVAPTPPTTSERGRSGSSRSNAPSPDRVRPRRPAAAPALPPATRPAIPSATSARATPSPPANTASRKPASSACQADGTTTAPRAARASSP